MFNKKLFIATIVVSSMTFMPNINYPVINNIAHAESLYSLAIQKFNEGITLMQSDRNVGALEKFSEAIQINPNYEDAYFYRGLVNIIRIVELRLPNSIWVGKAVSSIDQAIEDFNRVIKLNPNNFRAYFYRGVIYSELRDRQSAIMDYNKAIQLNPNYAEAYCEMAYDYYYLGNYQQSINDYNKAIQLNPNYAKAYFGRGVVYYRLRNHQQGSADYNKAISLDPSLSEYKGAYTLAWSAQDYE